MQLSNGFLPKCLNIKISKFNILIYIYIYERGARGTKESSINNEVSVSYLLAYSNSRAVNFWHHM
jgi:hypothetical protein